MSWMTHGRWLLLCAVCPLSGCMTVKTARARFPDSPPAKTEALRGIPFYIKTAGCKHQAVWAEMRYVVQYSQVTAGDPTANRAGEKTLDPTGNQSLAQDIALLTSISGKSITAAADRQKYRAALGRIAAARSATAPKVKDVSSLQKDPNIQLISDTASVQPYVDYSTIYYYNTARPLIGTSKVDVHLAADGTLTEGVSELTDTTGSTIASLATSLTGMAMGGVSRGVWEPSTSGPVPTIAGTSDTFTVTVAAKTYLHTIEEWRKNLQDPSSCTVQWNDPSTYSLNTVTLAPDVAAAKKDSTSKNAVQFSGEVQLPAAAPAATGASPTTAGTNPAPK